MKRSGILLIFIFVCTALFSGERILIVTTVNPYYLAAEELSCGLADVVNLIPVNASPHTYNPSPKDMLTLEKADIVIVNGLGLEEHMAEYLKNMKRNPLVISSVMMREAVKSENINPHIWLSAGNLVEAGRMISSAIKAELPSDSALIDSAFLEYSRRIMLADSIIKSERSHYEKASVVLFHNSFEYFCSDYSIDVAGVIERSPGKEPTAREMKELADIISAEKITMIFTEPQLNSKPVDILAKELSLDKGILDPLGTYFNEKTVDMILIDNWNQIKKSLRDGN